MNFTWFLRVVFVFVVIFLSFSIKYYYERKNFFLESLYTYTHILKKIYIES